MMQKISDEKWIEQMNNLEPILLTYSDNFYIMGEEKIFVSFHDIFGIPCRVILDVEKLQWISIYIIDYRKTIVNPETICKVYYYE